jgi:hypothetical protein
MITEISRNLNGVYDYANTAINFNANPYLSAGNDLTLYFTDNDSRYAAKVVSVSGNTAVIDFSDRQQNNRGVVAKTPNYGAGMTGAQDPWTFSFTNPPNGIIQASSTGGTSSISIEVSTDQNHWISLGTMAITSANSNTSYMFVSNPWPYGRINISSIGSNQSITVNKVI